MQIQVASRARRLLAVGAMVAFTAVTTFFWWHASVDVTEAAASVPSLGDSDRVRTAGAVPAVPGAPAARPVPDAELNYAQLDPAAFVRTPASFGGNLSYGQAMLLIACENHRQTQAEFKSENNLRALKEVDPRGQLLTRLQFENRVAELQCAGQGEQDDARVAALMAAAAEQGEPRARTWVLQRRLDHIVAQHDDASLGEAERAASTDEAHSMLSAARTLAAEGQRDAAMVASRLTSSDRFGLQNVAESATWLLVALQIPGREFNPRPEVFANEPYRDMSADQVAQARLQAFDTFQRCCNVPTPDQSARNPFAH